MIDRVRERHIDQRTIREDARDLSPEIRVQPVVVAHMQEPAAQEILAQSVYLRIAEPYVAVPGYMEEREIPHPVIEQRDAAFGLVDPQRRPLVDRFNEIRKARWVGVPVAALVLKTSDGETRPIVPGRAQGCQRDQRRERCGVCAYGSHAS